MRTGRGLGRGLGALIPGAVSGVREVPVESVRPNPLQPRTQFSADELEELAQSIREHGVLQPILVSEQPDGTYQLITGERRWRSAQLAGLSSVPAVVKEATPRASLEMALVENIQRRDLNPLEEALAFRQLIEDHGLTQDRLAQRLGKSRVSVTNTLRLLHLPAVVQDALAAGSITEGHARAILAAGSETARLALLDDVLAEHLSVRETEARARQANDESSVAVGVPPDLPTEAPGAYTPDPDTERLEDAFRQALGTRVRLVRGRRGGRLVIHFYSDDELQGLYEAIVRA